MTKETFAITFRIDEGQIQKPKGKPKYKHYDLKLLSSTDSGALPLEIHRPSLLSRYKHFIDLYVSDHLCTAFDRVLQSDTVH